MRPCVLLLLALAALSCCVDARQVAFVGSSLPNQIQQASQLLSSTSSSQPQPYLHRRPNAAKCYGLARRTRSRSVQVPVLYNSVSSQTAAVPDYLFSLDDGTIDKMEAEGWEVRMKSIVMPETFYQRVPTCCPWDTACNHNKQRMSINQHIMSKMGPCMNGGMLVPTGKAQVCVCPTGYKGVWCQITSMVKPSFGRQASPVVIPFNFLQDRKAPSMPDVLRQAARQAQMWREKIASSKQSPMMFGGRPVNKGPLLSPNDHIIKQWAQQRPSDNAMRMKMKMLMNFYMKQMGERMRNMPQGHLNAMTMTPMFKGKNMRTNPYSNTPAQPFVNPQMVSMINHLQGRPGVVPPVLPYGQTLLPVQTYRRGKMARNQGLNVPQARTPWDMDPWDRQRGRGQPLMGGPSIQMGRGQSLMGGPFMQMGRGQSLMGGPPMPMGRSQSLMGGPSMSMGRGQSTMGGPSMSMGRGQSMMGGPSKTSGRDQLMALAFAQYMQNIQKRLAGGSANGRGGMMQNSMTPQNNRRLPVREPQPNPMSNVNNGFPQVPAMMDTTNDMPQFQSDQSAGTTEMPNQITDSVELPAPVGVQEGLSQDNGPMAGQGLGHMAGAGPINVQQMGGMGPMNGQQIVPGANPMNGQMLQGMPMGAGGPMPKMPSQEELQKMTECRVVLEPRITMCMKDAGHDISLEHFMNPQYMANARGVCADSESVGQCVMRQDKACGEGDTVEMTRKMIDSVLQMMGMVCGQINKIDQERGGMGGPVPPMPQQGDSPRLATLPQNVHINKHTRMPVDESIPPTTHATDKLHSEPVGPSEPPSKSSDKFTTSKIGSAVTDKTPFKAASKSDKGHHSVEPVTSNTFIPGAPLWIVILIACIILLIACLSLIIIACAFRRRRRNKIKELERKAEPLDPKLYTLGIPPPHYATASIKTQDELSLPPLDLSEDNDSGTVSVKDDSDGEVDEEEEEVKKAVVSDEDADDESDEKEEEADKKKKEKKEKN